MLGFLPYGLPEASPLMATVVLELEVGFSNRRLSAMNGILPNPAVVLGTVQDCCCRFGSGFKSNFCEIGSPCGHYTRTIILDTVECKFFNLSGLDGLWVGPSLDPYDALVFGVFQLYIIKITYSTSNNLSLHVLHFGISIMLKSRFFLWYVVLLSTAMLNGSVVSSSICAMIW